MQNDDTSDEEIDDPPEETIGGQAEVDAMVLKRMKALETDLLSTKNKLSEISHSEAAARNQNESMRERLKGAEALVAKLEGDLALTSGAKNDKDTVTLTAEASVLHRSSGGENQSKIANDLELSELLGVDAKSIPVVKAKSGGATASSRQSSESSSQMISILQGQRDRYKGRLSAAEATQATLEAKLGVAQAKAQQMEKDNVTLYGKIRYLQSVVAGNNPGGRGVQSHISPQPMRISYSAAGAQEDANTTWGRLGLSERDNNESSDMESGMSLHRSQNLGTTNADIDDPEEKYKRMYEAKLNPFSQFNRTNQSGTIEDLSVSDHLIYTTLRHPPLHQHEGQPW